MFVHRCFSCIPSSSTGNTLLATSDGFLDCSLARTAAALQRQLLRYPCDAPLPQQLVGRLAEVLRNRFQRFVECESFACLEGRQVPDLRFSVGPRHVRSKSHATFTVQHETMATQTSLIRNRTNVRRCSKLLVTPHGSYTCLGLVVSAEILAMFWGIVAAPFGN